MRTKTLRKPLLLTFRLTSLLLTCFLLLFSGNTVNAAVTPIPKSTTAVLSTQITSVTIGGVPVECIRDAACEYQYVYFMYDVPATVVVTTANTIGTNSIHPSGRKIAKTVVGKTMTFDIAPVVNKATHLLVKIDGYDPLLIIGDKPETDVPVVNGTNIVSITASPYNAANDFSSDVTSKIQTAIDNMSARTGGGTVVFPAGTYKVFETLVMKSNVHIYLAPGAYIESDPSMIYPFKSSGSTSAIPVIELIEKKNVKLYGRGAIDANGTDIMDPDGGDKRRNIITGDINGDIESENLTIDGIMLKNGTTWTLDIKYANGVTIANVKVLNHWNQNNVKIQNDGINLCASRNGHVWNNFVMTGDDAFCVKAQDEADGGTRDCYNIQNHDNVSFNMAAGNKIGMNAKAEVYDVQFENNEIIACRRGIVVEALVSGNNLVYRPLHDITFSNITIDYYQAYDNFRELVFEFYASKSNIYNITVNNLQSLRVPADGGEAHCDGSNKIDGITFNWLKIGGKAINQSNYESNKLSFSRSVSNFTFTLIPKPPLVNANLNHEVPIYKEFTKEVFSWSGAEFTSVTVEGLASGYSYTIDETNNTISISGTPDASTAFTIRVVEENGTEKEYTGYIKARGHKVYQVGRKLVITGDPVQKVEIYSPEGRCMQKKDATNELELQELLPGGYVIKITDSDNAVESVKFIWKRN